MSIYRNKLSSSIIALCFVVYEIYALLDKT